MHNHPLSSDRHSPQEKEAISAKETRHQTTVKKRGSSGLQFRRTEPYNLGSRDIKLKSPWSRPYKSLNEQLSPLQMKKQRYMQAEEYSRAEEVDDCIRRSKQLQQRRRTRDIQRTQRTHRKAVNSAFQRQMHSFQNNWQAYFDQFNQRQLRMMIQFKQEQQRLLEETRQKLNTRCRSMRPRSKQLIDLQQKKKYFERKGDLRQLKLIKRERKDLLARLARKRSQQVDGWTTTQQRKFSNLQLTKYNNFVKKLEQTRTDLTRFYLHEKQRLHLKHRNALLALQHAHKMAMRSSYHHYNLSA